MRRIPFLVGAFLLLVIGRDFGFATASSVAEETAGAVAAGFAAVSIEGSPLSVSEALLEPRVTLLPQAEERLLYPSCYLANSSSSRSKWCVTCSYLNVPLCPNTATGSSYSSCYTNITGVSSFCGLTAGAGGGVCLSTAAGLPTGQVDLSVAYSEAAFNSWLVARNSEYAACVLANSTAYATSNGLCCDSAICRSRECFCPSACAAADVGATLPAYTTVEPVWGAQLCQSCCSRCFTSSFCTANSGYQAAFSLDDSNCCMDACTTSPASSLESFWLGQF
jgi:hypothetical protein